MKRILLVVLVTVAVLCGCGANEDINIIATPKSVTKPAPETTQKPTENNTGDVQSYQKEQKKPELAEEPEKVNTVSLVVECTDVLNNIECLKEEKRGIIPKDGIIYTNTEVEINEEDTVFDVLKRSLISSGVHLEFSMTPVYNSAYIEGIGNLYEFDCGERSGWKFTVNGEVPRVGCSGVKVKPSDKIVFFYKVIGY